MQYSAEEMMTVIASRELRDGEVVFVGIGLPNLACDLARPTLAPKLVLVYEAVSEEATQDGLHMSSGDR